MLLRNKGDSEQVKLVEFNKLAIATLGNISDHPRIVRLREYIENWYLSYFVPDAARILPPSGAQRWLDAVCRARSTKRKTS